MWRIKAIINQILIYSNLILCHKVKKYNYYLIILIKHNYTSEFFSKFDNVEYILINRENNDFKSKNHSNNCVEPTGIGNQNDSDRKMIH